MHACVNEGVETISPARIFKYVLECISKGYRFPWFEKERIKNEVKTEENVVSPASRRMTCEKLSANVVGHWMVCDGSAFDLRPGWKGMRHLKGRVYKGEIKVQENGAISGMLCCTFLFSGEKKRE